VGESLDRPRATRTAEGYRGCGRRVRAHVIVSADAISATSRIASEAHDGNPNSPFVPSWSIRLMGSLGDPLPLGRPQCIPHVWELQAKGCAATLGLATVRSAPRETAISDRYRRCENFAWQRGSRPAWVGRAFDRSRTSRTQCGAHAEVRNGAIPRVIALTENDPRGVIGRGQSRRRGESGCQSIHEGKDAGSAGAKAGISRTWLGSVASIADSSVAASLLVASIQPWAAEQITRYSLHALRGLPTDPLEKRRVPIDPTVTMSSEADRLKCDRSRAFGNIGPDAFPPPCETPRLRRRNSGVASAQFPRRSDDHQACGHRTRIRVRRPTHVPQQRPSRGLLGLLTLQKKGEGR